MTAALRLHFARPGAGRTATNKVALAREVWSHSAYGRLGGEARRRVDQVLAFALHVSPEGEQHLQYLLMQLDEETEGAEGT